MKEAKTNYTTPSNHPTLEPLFASSQGYKTNLLLRFFEALLVILTGGIFGLALLWDVKARRIFKLACEDIEAQVFFVGMLVLSTGFTYSCRICRWGSG